MEHLKIDGHYFYNMLINANNRLEEQKNYIDSLNVFPVPDGDTGTNMSMTFNSAVLEIENMQHESIGEISKKLARGALMGARGNSGVILSQILRGIANGLEGKEKVNSLEFANSIMQGADTAYKAVMRPTEGTILTVIRIAGESALKSENEDITKLMEEVCNESENVLNKTPEMLPVLKKAKVVDAGGAGLLIILKGMYEVLKNDLQSIFIQENKKTVNKAPDIELKQDIKYGYCTEFFIKGTKIDVDNFRDELKSQGDCLLVIGEEDIVKVHIHTNDPGLILSKAVKCGELSKIKIDNMREQHRHIIEEEYSSDKNDDIETSFLDDEEVNEEVKKFGFVTVALGEGITNIFKDLGVDNVIHGGQTMNPSTEDILKAINTINAENIFVLPNNKNIVMSATQAAELSDKNVIVVSTKTIPQGITALTVFNPDLELEENIKAMEESIKCVSTASVTYAVRDTEMDGKCIKEGNILGLIEGKISEVGTEVFNICENLMEKMVKEDNELITIFYGKDCEEEQIESFSQKIQDKYEDIDVQFYKGEQPLYYFIISVE